jgi:hypothetical protein
MNENELYIKFDHINSIQFSMSAILEKLSG